MKCEKCGFIFNGEKDTCPYCGSEEIKDIRIDLEDLVYDFMDKNSQQIYDIFCEQYPEKVNSDTLIEEDYPDETYEIAKELLFTRKSK